MAQKSLEQLMRELEKLRAYRKKYRWHYLEDGYPKTEGKYLVMLPNGEYEVIVFTNDLYNFDNEYFGKEYIGKKGFVRWNKALLCYQTIEVLKWKEIE